MSMFRETYLLAQHYFIPLLKSDSDSAKTFMAVNSFAACLVNRHIANTAYCSSKFAQVRLVEFNRGVVWAEGCVLAMAVAALFDG